MTSISLYQTLLETMMTLNRYTGENGPQKILPIVIKLRDLDGIALIKMPLNFHVKILFRTLLFHD